MQVASTCTSRPWYVVVRSGKIELALVFFGWRLGLAGGRDYDAKHCHNKRLSMLVAFVQSLLVGCALTALMAGR